MRLRDKRSSRALVDSLEARRLLSGNVTVAAAAGTMTVTGDNKANEFVVEAIGTGYEVTGLNGTTINGGASVIVPTFGGLLNVVIDTGNGADDVLVARRPVTNANESFDLSISTGNGDDTVTVNSWHALGDMTIETGNGPDSVALNGIAVNDDLTVLTGNGPDDLSFGSGTFIAANTVGGDTLLDGGHGPDSLTGLGTLLTLGTQDVLDF